MRLAVVGLGKLGSPLAAVLASQGHDIVGIDHNRFCVDRINAGEAPVVEPQLQRLIETSKHRLCATTSYEEGIAGTDMSFVIVPTPSNKRGAFSNKHVLSAVVQIGRVLRHTGHYHVVNIISTVMPGSTGGEIRRRLEAASGRKIGRNLGLTYNPEFVALGSVVHDLLHPDMMLIGESDERAGDLLEAVFRRILDGGVPVHRMNFINAEITKLAINAYVTTKITFANMLSGLCEALPGADVDVITRALGTDSRIGAKYLRGALGYGGPCFPRDNLAFARLATDLAVRADLVLATHSLNLHQVERLTNLVLRLSPSSATVAVLGLSYKPDTPVIDESQGIMLAFELAQRGRKVVVYDPIILDSAMAVLRENAERAASAVDAITKADAIVICTPFAELNNLPVSAFQRPDGRRLTIIDCWRMLSPEVIGPSADLIYLGVGDTVTAQAKQVGIN